MDVVVPVLECRNLTKRYGTVQALTDVDFTLRRGEVRALLGKNGAGKSTLVNLVSGAVQPDSGTIRLNGKDVRWDGPGAARSGGISVVHQEFSLVPGLTVAENITMGRWSSRLGFIDQERLQDDARRALDQLGEDIPLWQLVGSLPIAQQQLVEIAKALVDNPDVLILDEPTSALNASEVEVLLALVRRLAATGVSVIYVSHRMNEIPLVADAMTVFRDGREVATLGIGEASPERVAAMIAGEVTDVAAAVYHDRSDAPVALSVRGLAVDGVLEDVSFDLHEGEVLGIAGFLGSGRTELLEAIFGLRHDVRGSVWVNGKEVRGRRPRKMLARRVAMTSEDRKGAGIVPAMGTGENVLLTARSRVLPKIWLRRRAESRLQADTIDKLAIRTSSPAQEVGTLSGGNQQKAVIGRALAAEMRVLLLDEPTRGIDVHAKAQVYALIRELAAAGHSAIFVSSELEEMPLVCDRVVVLRAGRSREVLTGAESNAERILALTMKEDD
ncbi:sugar ABC transporter ATP-binding protein [Nocardioides humilatus]|uniref:Sugar ABC transporter ATP-binding protein n=1 Tax=Nocardioides humilatus TaxID=2607660 RepID=A0A5B1LMV2_9ACTN|nr:sugar ABC transporter ATP-binding protein [Nocardioides humilatus]KAA1421806.1 sugar ABC transporter ATP-binding protein [Nocardioides humilatus]